MRLQTLALLLLIIGRSVASADPKVATPAHGRWCIAYVTHIHNIDFPTDPFAFVDQITVLGEFRVTKGDRIEGKFADIDGIYSIHGNIAKNSFGKPVVRADSSQDKWPLVGYPKKRNKFLLKSNLYPSGLECTKSNSGVRIYVAKAGKSYTSFKVDPRGGRYFVGIVSEYVKMRYQEVKADGSSFRSDFEGRGVSGQIRGSEIKGVIVDNGKTFKFSAKRIY